MTPPPDLVAPELPAWEREPAKIVGWIVAAALAVAAGVTELVAQFSDLIPDRYAPTVKVVVGAAAFVTVIATRVQALLTRNGIGPAGNGKDGVVSPATHTADIAVAQASARRGGDGTGLPGEVTAAGIVSSSITSADIAANTVTVGGAVGGTIPPGPYLVGE